MRTPFGLLVASLAAEFALVQAGLSMYLAHGGRDERSGDGARLLRARCISAPRQAKPASGDDLKESHERPGPEPTRVVVVGARVRGSVQHADAEYVKRAMTSKGTA